MCEAIEDCIVIMETISRLPQNFYKQFEELLFGYQFDETDAQGYRTKGFKTYNGNVHGECQGWYEDGSLKYICNYEDGEYNGRYRWWYEEGGNLECEGYYVNGNEHGNFKRWYEAKRSEATGEYENGEILSDENYNEGKKDGVCRLWFPNKQIKFQLNYTEDKLHGNAKWWFENGQLWRNENYNESRRHGKCVEWYPNGKLRYYVFYDNNHLDQNINI